MSIKTHLEISVAETVEILQVQFLFEVDDVSVVFATTGKDGPDSAEICWVHRCTPSTGR